MSSQASSQNRTSTDSVIHLVCGATGAGKSTYANILKKEFNAVYFAVDDWMSPLFGPDIKDPMDWEWISERATRCEDKIISTAIALAQTGTSSVLELGLHRAAARSAVTSTISTAGSKFNTHYLNVDAEERWNRVQIRNREKGATFRLTVNKGIFDFFENMWEAPTQEELVLLNSVELLSD